MKHRRKLYVVANSHLDTQWNWTIIDTIRDCVKHTLDDNFALMDKYPAYRLSFEGAFRYSLAKEYYPEKYEKLKDYVARGQWVPVGAAWDAMDANVPSSEALMRQILLGNGYFEREFGKRSSDIFLADCFGFRYALPSIGAHMGLKGFSTQKLVWGVGTPILNPDGSVTRPMPDDEKPRMDLGKWKGPDGNSLIVSLLEGDYTTNFDSKGDTRPINERGEYLEDIEINEKNADISKHSMYFGTGDYGGACHEASARMVQEACDANGNDNGLFEVVSASTSQIMEELTPEEEKRLPVYDGMLLIPHGFGAMTSRTINKRWNRKSELIADSAERICAAAALTCGYEYPRERLDFAWKRFLWHQFHDDVTGTSIAPAYVFSHNDYIVSQNIFASELTAGLSAVVSALDTKTKGTPLAVYNPVSCERNARVEAKIGENIGCVRVYTPDGTELPSQLENTEEGKKVVFAAKLPPVSVTVFDLVCDEASCAVASAVSADIKARTLSNAAYSVAIDENGDICSVFDKRLGRELLSAPCRFAISPDHSSVYPAWEFDFSDNSLAPEYVGGKAEFTLVESGSASAAIKVSRKCGNSKFTYTVCLWEGGDRVDISCEVDWRHRASLLRAVFPFTASSPVALFDQGLGADTGDNTTYYPYYQRNMHQWADLTDAGGEFGVTLMNDCKYGADKPDDNTLRVAIIHTPNNDFMPISGQSWQDRGRNVFSFAIEGHSGACAPAASEAECLNRSPLAFEVCDKHTGNGRVFSLVSVSDPDITVRAFKREEKGERWIVRVQETSGKGRPCSLTFARPLASAVETNGYEDELCAVSYDGDTLPFDIGRYGVKTFAVTFASGCDAKESTAEYKTLALPFTQKGCTTNETRGENAVTDGISIPAEIYREELKVGGVPAKLAPADENNMLYCDGQKISLPDGADRLYLFAASVSGDKKVSFAGKEITVQDWRDNVGSWYSPVAGTTYVIKHDDIAECWTHTHDKDGDRLYSFAYLFRYEFDVTGIREFTLPSDKSVIVMAATARVAGAGDVRPASDLYDRVSEKVLPYRRLTVEGSRGSGEYREGSEIFLIASVFSPFGVFRGWKGEGERLADSRTLVVSIGDHDLTVKAEITPVGVDLIEKKPCKANGYVNNNETPERALNGRERGKWCSSPDENGEYWLEADAGSDVTAYSWLVMHAGTSESQEWNTRDFSLEIRKDGSDEWTCADCVKDNEESLTLRPLDAVTARYFRLKITKATWDHDKHCRIFAFRVYGAPVAPDPDYIPPERRSLT